ncbi:MAG: hypothetical protein J6L79_07330, partial [Muribaculaceae bacterium]|nr:hypothetical protein [Muribaculaceae bacterium]
METKGGRLRRLSDSQGRVYGWTVDGKVYLNRDAMNPETPLHEYTHLWDEMVQRENPELWARGKELLKQTPMWEQVLHDPNYADIADDENAVASEVHSRLTGREGAKLLQDMIDNAKKDGALETARIVTLVEKLKGWLSDMFKALKATLGKWGKRDLRNLTVEDFNRMVIRDLADGVNPRHGDRSLIGVHNLTEQKLMKALKIGGLVNPSVAVIDINRGKHEGYGEISLVLPSSKIDKGNGNVGTWPGDAWTPTYPTVERRMKGDGADLPGLDMAKLPEVMKEYVRRAFNGWLDGRGNEGMAYWFLHERGEAPDVVRRERIYTVQEASRILRNVKEKDSFGGLTRKPLSELTEEERATVKDAYIKHKFNGNEAAYNEAVHAKRELWEKLIKDYPETSFRHKSAARNLAKLEKTGLAPAVDSWLDEVQADINAGNRQLPESTSLEANKIINDKNLRNEFDKWVDSLTERYGIEEVIFDGYTPSGERKYVKNTAKNVSRLMREQGRNAATGWGTSFTRFVAAVMSHMPNKEAIRKEKTRLTTDDNAIDAFDGKWQDVFFELGLKCQPDATGRFDDYGLERLTEAVGYKDPVGYLKKEYGVELSAEDVMKLMSMIDAIRRERPAKYFETKFERPVQLDEFSAAVVPATIEPMLEKAITDAGLKVVKYDAKEEGDRQRALREASDDRSIRFQIMGERGAERLDRAEEVTMRLDNLAVAREMEKAKNSPRAIKIATGWERGADNLWRYEVPDFKIDPKGLARKNSLWNNLPWGKDFDELSDKIFEGGELTEEESVRFDRLAEKATEMRKLYEESDVRYLDDYVRDKELFEAYPEFKQMRVEMYDDPMDSKGGAYYFSQKLIRINASKLGNFGIGDLRSVLAHEVQHAIQEAEGFTKGGTPEEAYDTIKKDGYEFLDGFSSNQLYDLSRLKREAEDCVKEGKYKYLTNAVKHILKEERKHSWYAWIDRHDNDGNFTLVYDVLLEFTSDELYAAAEIDTAEFYHRISGEVEARNVQKRMRMTADRRRRSLLQSTEDVSREDQIFLWLRNKHSAADLGMLQESDAEYGVDGAEEEDVLCRPVTDKATLDRLNSEPTIKVYRAMQMIDGGLRPPMSGKVDGQWRDATEVGVWEEAEEHPEMANENGRFKLDKGNGKSIKAAYNPYIHTSRSPINDQFSSAWSRPELVIVEVEIPESELTSGYHAEKAKNTVGEMPWHSGTVSGQLAKLGKPRRVILSRYDRPVRIVPFKEVAAMIAEQLDGTDIEIPYNVVQPQVRAELERLGVAIGEEATGTVDDGDFGEAEYVTDQE